MADSTRVNTLEHYLFRNYSIGVKKWLENNVYLHKYPVDDNVKVIYGTPAAAWAEYIYPTLNAHSTTPIINFHLSNMEYLDGENHLGFARKYEKVGNKYIITPPPLIYRLTYPVTFFARTQAELDIIFYQILSKAHRNRKAAIIVDNQWAEILATDPEYETNLEPPSSEDVIRRGSLKIEVARAYIPQEVKTYEGIIEAVDISYIINNGEET